MARLILVSKTLPDMILGRDFHLLCCIEDVRTCVDALPYI